MGMVVTELMERGFQQQRKEDPNLDCLIRQHVKMHDQLESVLDEESKQLFAEYHKIFTEIDGYQEKYIYLGGCINSSKPPSKFSLSKLLTVTIVDSNSNTYHHFFV